MEFWIIVFATMLGNLMFSVIATLILEVVKRWAGGRA